MEDFMHHITFAKLVSLCVRVCVFREEAVTGGGNQCSFMVSCLTSFFPPAGNGLPRLNAICQIRFDQSVVRAGTRLTNRVTTSSEWWHWSTKSCSGPLCSFPLTNIMDNDSDCSTWLIKTFHAQTGNRTASPFNGIFHSFPCGLQTFYNLIL